MSMPDPDPHQQQPQQPQQPPPYAPQYGYGPYQYQYPLPRPTNGFSIAALVCGIVGACTPLSILGLIFGMIAKRQIQERGEQGEGMATAGIVLGWIGVASILFWIAYVVFIVGVFSTAVGEIDEWPTPSEDPSWAIRLLTGS